ncbi:hypothetical protein BCR33DRAFT_666440, partial [Rhizoclosmatium globosum]
LEWPPSSPDLNPIENLWHILKVWRQKKYGLPRSRDELIEQIFAVWEEIDSSLCESLLLSIHNRLEECVRVKGRWTRY